MNDNNMDEELGTKVLTVVTDHILTVLDEVFQQHYNDIIALVPIQYRYMITKSFVRRIVKGSRSVINKLDSNIKRSIAVDIRNVMNDIEGEYMRTVMKGKPDKSLGMLLQEMGEVHWNGI
ncbi:MAG: hypothetical protein QXL94_03050 [Candidatus Parvarchaeum sp.]